MAGFEPTAPSSRTKCATKLRYIPTAAFSLYHISGRALQRTQFFLGRVGSPLPVTAPQSCDSLHFRRPNHAKITAPGNIPLLPHASASGHPSCERFSQRAIAVHLPASSFHPPVLILNTHRARACLAAFAIAATVLTTTYLLVQSENY